MSLLSLPDECLHHVLRQLGDARRRLATARACTRLRRAAAAAVDSISAEDVTAAKHDSMQLYLGQHGQHVASITISISYDDDVTIHTLPNCASLQDLDLTYGTVQLAAGGGHQGVLQAATGLTRLSLTCCEMQDDASSVAAALATLSGLRELKWNNARLVAGAGGATALPGHFLSSLVQLTRLQLCGNTVQDCTLQHLGCLTNLQDLEVTCSSVTDATFAGLHELQQLTRLRLESMQQCVGSGSTAGLSRLTGLRQLQVDFCDGFAPACLAGLSQLQQLSLTVTPMAGGADGVAVFLQQLAGLQQLQQLALSAMRHCAAAAAAYSALTASSHLSSLQILECELPQGVWQHVFAPTRPLPNLVVFASRNDVRMAAGDVDNLVSCCPQLHELTYELLEPSSQSLAPLLRLLALTELHVTGASDAAVLGAPLCKLTGLRSLMLDGRNRLSGATLLQLTALEQLTYLYVALPSVEDEDDEDDEEEPHVCFETPEGAPPDVASQLLRHCLECHEPCQVPLSLLAQQEQRLTQQAEQLAQQAEQLAQQRNEHRACGAELRQQLASKERRAAAHDAEAAAHEAELRSRVSRLEQLLAAQLAASVQQQQA